MLFHRRSCWVCFATVEDDYDAKWVKPCRCRGTTKWVHQTCLQRWVDEKQKGNSSAEVYCPQCGTRYIIVFPEFGRSTPSHQPVCIYVVNTLTIHLSVKPDTSSCSLNLIGQPYLINLCTYICCEQINK